MSVKVNLQDYSADWRLSEQGIWRNQNIQEISYPEDGNEQCFRLEDESFWFLHRNRIISAVVARFRPRGIFFDVGGGNGFVAKSLQDHGYTTVLVEPGGQGVANAVQRGVENVVQSMWSPEIVRPGVADAVGLFDVVEHIQEDRKFLQGVHETLSAEGLVFITVPAFQWLWSHEDTHAGHFRRYKLSQLRSLLQGIGFRIEFSSYFFCPLTLPILLLRSLPSLIGLRTKADPATTTSEHSQKSGLAGKIIGRSLSWEASRISTGKSVPFGSSCLIVGRKTIDRK